MAQSENETLLNELESHNKAILQLLGEDTTREGLLKTPRRVASAWTFLTKGNNESATDIMKDAIFNAECHNTVIVKDIEYYSMCEHHMLPFFGKAHIAYLPRGKVLGLSKFGRVVDVFARRLQMQERLTQQIAHALTEALDAEGVLVVLDGVHMCMAMRGVQKPNAKTITTCATGVFKDKTAEMTNILLGTPLISKL
eukprot:TRINITY_DN96583_c0_g1_i1.p1 TRINITY_DN96583_c0_g1~~TRINITY_DN96583_c0_g1_i1.p1  ORF type:complete len:197 (-),score=13.49 TRINITY_DN96583_c0_g1_i1:195-785(-)